MPRVLSQHEWEQRRDAALDTVSVRNLHIHANAGVDVWGRRKAQPVSISVTLSLNQPFKSAAEGDVVDDSTVHYGKLSKNILAAVEAETSTEKGLGSDALLGPIDEAARRTAASPELLNSVEIDIFYPKASLLGDGAGVHYSAAYQTRDTSQVLYLRNIRIPTIVGVNSHERAIKQAVVANVWIDKARADALDGYTQVEKIVTDTISELNFETLESLATKVAFQVIEKFINVRSPGSNVRLRVEKPVAVPFADAPAIEIYRSSGPDQARQAV